MGPDIPVVELATKHTHKTLVYSWMTIHCPALDVNIIQTGQNCLDGLTGHTMNQVNNDHANLDIQSVTDLECLTDVASVTADGHLAVKTEDADIAVYDNYNFNHAYDERLAITKHREE
ncbi:hypothetical protein CAPTEDRAFT_202007, partial [Capitella teleta]